MRDETKDYYILVILLYIHLLYMNKDIKYLNFFSSNTFNVIWISIYAVLLSVVFITHIKYEHELEKYEKSRGVYK